MAKATTSDSEFRPLKNDPTCSRCNLRGDSATVCCASTGPKRADLFFVGEALGANEEELGRPFVGDAGYKLNYLLKKAGTKRKAVRIGNVVRCRPPKNRVPKAVEIKACLPYLTHDILVGKPKAIVAMGATAVKAIMGPRKLDHSRGFPQQITFEWRKHRHTCWVVPTYHPAACLHWWGYDDLVVFDIELARKLAAGEPGLIEPTTKVEVVDTLDKALQLIRRLKRARRFVLDLETTGLDPHNAEILCVGFCTKPGQASILPLLQQYARPIWKPQEKRQIVEALADLLEEAPLVGQNIKFDIKHLRKLTGIVDYNIVFDTLLAHRCVDENKPHRLTFLCQYLLGWKNYDRVMGKYLDPDAGYAPAPNTTLWEYCGRDVDGTFQVMQKLIPLLKKEKTVRAFKNDLGLINPLADMEFRGVQTDRARLDRLSEYYRKERAQVAAKLERTARAAFGDEYDEICKGKDFNPNSKPQLVTLLQAVGAQLKKKTPTGAPSTDKLVLAALSLRKNKAGTLARNQMRLRKLTKYVSTYLDGADGESGLAAHIKSKDRVHANYKIETVTGRLAEKYMQTIPRVGALRTFFTPDEEDCVLLACDYEKLELCVMAWLANDMVMGRELISGIDLHRRMAVTVRLGRDPTDEEFAAMAPDVKKDERAIAKGVNFGIPYGRGSLAIVEANPDAFSMDMGKQQRIAIVDKMIEAYFEKYFACHDYLQRCVDTVHDRGELRTLVFGRKRRLHGIEWFNSQYGMMTSHRDMDLGHLEREGRNYEIQSIASDTLSAATKRVYRAIQREGIPRMRMVMTLHDALYYSVPRVHVEDAEHLIKTNMEVVLQKDKRHRLEMPLRVEVLRQRFWGEEMLKEEPDKIQELVLQ